ncbi:MAG TPA: hypothetical protein VGH66_08490, partial [Acidimicrobiales bacterium]
MADPRRWGIDVGYDDAGGTWRQAPQETVDRFLEVMGATAGDPVPGPVLITSPGRPLALPGAGRLRLEDGTAVEVRAAGSPDLPLGYHTYEPADGSAARKVIVSPGRCWFTEDLRMWGWAAQLYATRSSASWGLGDLADLRRLGRWAASRGAGLTLINPLHAAIPSARQEP